jgi:glycerate kinase
MRILIAPDSFKDALSAPEVCRAIAAGLRISHPDATLCEFPMADGGEGALEVLAWHMALRVVEVESVDALRRPLRAAYGLTADGRTAVIEMARTAGLELLNATERDAATTSTLGTGLMIKDAAARGVERIVLAIGGSATNDAGIGIATALGWQFLDSSGTAVEPVGGRLSDIHRIVRPSQSAPTFATDVMCDVDNPLYGPRGAAFVYAAQKGADAAMVERLDDGLRHFATVLQRLDAAAQPGAGAAGGVGFGALVFLNASLHRGIDVIMDLTQFDAALRATDLVISGEGHLDAQTLSGKLIRGICQRARRFGVPVIALCGRISASRAQIDAIGLRDAVCINEAGASLPAALAQTVANLTRTAAALSLS